MCVCLFLALIIKKVDCLDKIRFHGIEPTMTKLFQEITIECSDVKFIWTMDSLMPSSWTLTMRINIHNNT